MEKLHVSCVIMPVVVIGFMGLTYAVTNINAASSLAAKSTLEAGVVLTAESQIGNTNIPLPPPGVKAYYSGVGRCSASAAMTESGPAVFTAWHCFQAMGAGTELEVTWPYPETISIGERTVIGDLLKAPYISEDNMSLPPTCADPLRPGDSIETWTFPGKAMESTEKDAQRVLYYSKGEMLNASSNGMPAASITISPGSSGGGIYKRTGANELCLGGAISSVNICGESPCVTVEIIPPSLK